MKKIGTFLIYLSSVIISCLFVAIIIKSCSSNSWKEKDVEALTEKGWDYCGFYINNVVRVNSVEDKYWMVYNDPDADFNYTTISMDEETYYLLLEVLRITRDLKPYSKEWNEVCDEHEFVILYKEHVNILVPVDKD